MTVSDPESEAEGREQSCILCWVRDGWLEIAQSYC